MNAIELAERMVAARAGLVYRATLCDPGANQWHASFDSGGFFTMKYGEGYGDSLDEATQKAAAAYLDNAPIDGFSATVAIAAPSE